MIPSIRRSASAPGFSSVAVSAMWPGRAHSLTLSAPERRKRRADKRGAGTLAVIGDLKQMNPQWLVGTSFLGYGATLTVGIGVPIPILNEEILKYTLVTDAEYPAPVVDYSDAYPNRRPDIVG